MKRQESAKVDMRLYHLLVIHDVIFIARQHTDARYSKSVRLSVRYFLVLYENGLTYCHNFFTIH